MKPLGMTFDFRVTKITPTEDAVWGAVEAAIDAGWTAQRFRAEVAEAWEHYLREKSKDDLRVLRGE